MDRRTFMKLAAVSAASMSLGLQFGCNGGDDPLDFVVMSDAHLYDPSLGTTGTAFEAHLAVDPKLLRESETILQTVLDMIEDSDAAFVLVPGDMTKDGERVGHELMVSHLARLKAAGKRIYVVPGNHDVLNPQACSYSGATTTPVPSVTAAEFAALYADYGYDAAFARDPDSLSYVAELADGYWLLAMDTCIYENNTTGAAMTAGEFSASTLAWLRARLAEARQQGKTVLGLAHHALTEHFDGQDVMFPGYVINDWANVSRTLAQDGLRFVFSGHFHATDAVERTWTNPDARLVDIETGSLVAYPCPFRRVRIEGGVMSVTTDLITSINYSIGATTFQEYARNAERTTLLNIMVYMLMAAPYSLVLAQAQQFAPYFVDALLAHYAGDEAPDASTAATLQSFLASLDPATVRMGQYLTDIWTDLPPSDNVLSVAMD